MFGTYLCRNNVREVRGIVKERVTSGRNSEQWEPLNDRQITERTEALRERRPPWPRQIITLILPTVKMLSLGCERLPTPLKKNKK